jgi:dynein heavy chain
MNDLVKIHTYYIYSLAAFTLVFYRGIDLASVLAKKAVEGAEGEVKAVEEEEKRELNDEELAKRCNVLIDSITKTVFNYVRRGVFERDKLTVSTLLVLKIMVNDGHLSQEEVRLPFASPPLLFHVLIHTPQPPSSSL